MIAFFRNFDPQSYRLTSLLAQQKPIDQEKAAKQYTNFLKSVESLGVEVERLSALHDQPESVFVSDSAVLLPEVAVIVPPTNPARRAEVESIAKILAGHRPVQHIGEPGNLNGNDVLPIGHTIYVARKNRPPGVRRRLAGCLRDGDFFATNSVAIIVKP